mgnify:CR=1 FL=1
MKKFAVIDIGSNSVRLMFVADGKVLYKTIKTTRLGEGLAFSPLLKSEAIERTISAMQEFLAKARDEGSQSVYAFATAAVRSAEKTRQRLTEALLMPQDTWQKILSQLLLPKGVKFSLLMQ